MRTYYQIVCVGVSDGKGAIRKVGKRFLLNKRRPTRNFILSKPHCVDNDDDDDDVNGKLKGLIMIN